MPILLSPAGSRESLIRAVNCGTDTVYFGVGSFNARANADNCTVDDLREWVKFCHLFGVKTYVTVNIAIKDRELHDAYRLLDCIYKAKSDGVIVTDIALAKYAIDNLTGIEVFASTQMNTANSLSTRFLERLGVDGVVLSRELSLSDIRTMVDATYLKTEIFIHGALCVSASGQCLMSSMISGRSGNRGMCAQPCRQLYSCVDRFGKEINKGYLLSMRDLCTLDKIREFSNCGVDVMKIEGRNRKPAYTGQTALSYSKALRNGVIAKESGYIKRIFNRGDFTDGYLYRTESDSLIYTAVPNHIGVRAGTIIEVDKAKNIAVLKSSMRFHKGDCFRFMGKDKEANAVYSRTLSEDKSGFLTAVGYTGNVYVGDAVNITTDSELEKGVEAVERTIGIEAFLQIGDMCRLTLTEPTSGTSICVEEGCTSKQTDNCLDEGYYRTQIEKTGGTPFTIKRIVVNCDGGYVPKSILNGLRRRALDELEQEIIKEYERRNIDNGEMKHNNKPISYNCCLSSETDTNKVIRTVEATEDANNSIMLIINDKQLTDSRIVSISKGSHIKYTVVKPENYSKFVVPEDIDWYLYLPASATNSELEMFKQAISKGAKGVVANNSYGVELAAQTGVKLILGTGMNVFNSRTIDVIDELYPIEAYAYSVELNENEMKYFGTPISGKRGYMYAEGFVSDMQLAHCPIKLNYHCACNNCKYDGDIYYHDKYGNRYAIRRTVTDRCRYTLYNCDKTSLIGRLDYTSNCIIDISCCDDKDDIGAVVGYYEYLIDKGCPNGNQADKNTTAGHFNRGV
ncbi:MAG: U32 family peptidase [Clostridia bacterium]|nr:U32 family peptidase [Clostridia bacterium]